MQKKDWQLMDNMMEHSTVPITMNKMIRIGQTLEMVSAIRLFGMLVYLLLDHILLMTENQFVLFM
jgi:hypothetical protein